MLPSTRAMIAASAHALVTGRKVAGLYDHAAARHLRIAAESQGEHLQGYDGDRDARFGGTLPELYDARARAFVSFAIEGATVRGFDRTSNGFYTAQVGERLVRLFDHADEAWYDFGVTSA